MALPTTTTLPTTQGVLYAVPAGLKASIGSIHVVNQSGGARTFTVYLKPIGGTAQPISPISQALAVGAMAIYADTIALTAGCTIEGIADAASVNVVITGVES